MLLLAWEAASLMPDPKLLPPINSSTMFGAKEVLFENSCQVLSLGAVCSADVSVVAGPTGRGSGLAATGMEWFADHVEDGCLLPEPKCVPHGSLPPEMDNILQTTKLVLRFQKCAERKVKKCCCLASGVQLDSAAAMWCWQFSSQVLSGQTRKCFSRGNFEFE